MKHQAWLVDLDGTLYHGRPVKLAMLFELALRGRRALPAIRAFRREHERLRHDLTRTVDSPYALQIQRAAGTLSSEPAALERLVAEWMLHRPSRWIRRFPRRSLVRRIEAFRRAGGKTAVVSDYPARHKLAALGLQELFDVVIANGEPGGPGRLKPWPDGYLLAAEHLGIAPEACLVIGDRADADGEAARRAGMAYRAV